jgi:hypothetical protein
MGMSVPRKKSVNIIRELAERRCASSSVSAQSAHTAAIVRGAACVFEGVNIWR